MTSEFCLYFTHFLQRGHEMNTEKIGGLLEMVEFTVVGWTMKIYELCLYWYFHGYALKSEKSGCARFIFALLIHPESSHLLPKRQNEKPILSEGCSYMRDSLTKTLSRKTYCIMV
jgi:hypothetical protein